MNQIKYLLGDTLPRPLNLDEINQCLALTIEKTSVESLIQIIFSLAYLADNDGLGEWSKLLSKPIKLYELNLAIRLSMIGSPDYSKSTLDAMREANQSEEKVELITEGMKLILNGYRSQLVWLNLMVRAKCRINFPLICEDLSELFSGLEQNEIDDILNPTS